MFPFVFASFKGMLAQFFMDHSSIFSFENSCSKDMFHRKVREVLL